MDEKQINRKLNAPKKLSQFEQQRQDAESKRIKEEASRLAALREFEEEFAADPDDDDDPISALAAGRGSLGAFGGGGGARDAPSGPRGGGASMEGSLRGPRHFSQSMRNSGPGTLGPPPSLKRKREMEEELERRERERRERKADGHMWGFDNDREQHSSRRKSLEPEPAVRRPTMLLAQLPKTIKEDEIRRIMPAKMKVDDVNFIPPAGPGSDRRFASAIVTVAASTPMSDVDAAVSALQTKYLGFGCYLKISRHVTSSIGGLGPGLGSHAMSNQLEFQPFGAKPWARDPQIGSMRHAPPPESLDRTGHGFQGYGQQPRHQGPAPMVAIITPPTDLKLLKAVHKTAEKVIQYGGVFEKALLSNPTVQHDESWAWIFDPTSQSSLYYRWLIYEYYAGRSFKLAKQSSSPAAALAALQPDPVWQHSPEGQFAKKNGLVKLFDHGPLFQPPRDRPKFEFVLDLEDLVEDSGYVSSSDESGDEGPARPNPTPALDVLSGTSSGYLNPYRKARFTHLLARMPDAIAMLRTGDVARVTSFVVNNAGSGAEEIVSMLVENITLPYSRHVQYNTSLSDLDDSDTASIPDSDDEEGWDRREKRELRCKNDEEKKRSDSSNAKLIALYLVSDALQASSTSGVRDAWKYRGLFESALRSRKIFEHLGRLDKTEKWGRMKAEQWKRKIGVVLGLWEKWSVFSADTQKIFKEGFLNPPLSAEELLEKEKAEKEEREKVEGRRWKSGTSTPAETNIVATPPALATSAATVAGVNDMDDDTTKPETAKTEQQAANNPKVLSKQPSMSERLAALKKNARAARPTAADLLDKKEDVPVPVAAPAPKISVGGFKLSLGSGGGGNGGAGFSLGTKAKTAGADEEGDGDKGKKRVADVGDMFGDSDGD